MKLSELIGELLVLFVKRGDLEVWAGPGQVLHKPEIQIVEDITFDEIVRLK